MSGLKPGRGTLAGAGGIETARCLQRAAVVGAARYFAVVEVGDGDVVVRVTAEDQAAIRRALREAGSHVDLARVCAMLMAQYAISYGVLRDVADIELPDYLAGVSSGARRQASPTGKSRQLSATHIEILISAYRDAFAEGGQQAADRDCIKKFARQFGVSPKAIEKALAADLRAHAAEYGALNALANERRAHKQRKRDARRQRKVLRDMPRGMSLSHYVGAVTYCPVCGNDFGRSPIPQHGAAPYGCRGSGRLASTLYSFHQARREAVEKAQGGGPSSSSVRTVRGGLPGLGG